MMHKLPLPLMLLPFLLGAQASAQPFTFFDIPWGISEEQARPRLHATGYRFEEDASGDAGRRAGMVVHRYANSGKGSLIVRYLEGRLVSVSENHWVAGQQSAEGFYVMLRDSLERLHGMPATSDSTRSTWDRGETQLMLTGPTASDNGGYSVYLTYLTPEFWVAVSRTMEETSVSLQDYNLPSLSDRWFVAYFDDEFRVAVENNLQPQGNAVQRAWVRWDYRSKQTKEVGFKTIEFDSSMTRYDYDCRNRRTRILDFTYRLDGAVMHSYDPSPGPWSAVQPETVGESVLTAVCARAERK